MGQIRDWAMKMLKGMYDDWIATLKSRQFKDRDDAWLETLGDIGLTLNQSIIARRYLVEKGYLNVTAYSGGDQFHIHAKGIDAIEGNES